MLKAISKFLIFSLIFSIYSTSYKFSFAKNIDIKKDEIINSEDLNELLPYIGSKNKIYDLNDDGFVDGLDLSIIAKKILVNEDLILNVYKDNKIIGSFSQNNLTNAISLACKNNGIVKKDNKVIWNNKSYFVYSNKNLINKFPTIRESLKSAENLENSIIISKNGNIIYDKNSNYRKIMGVTRTNVNLRNEANKSSRSNITIPNETLVEVENIINGLYKISYYDKENNLRTGFVPSYLDIIQDDFNNSQLGYISAREESNGDPGALGLNPNDKGGASFGVWQLSSKMGSVDRFLDFIKNKNEKIYFELSEAKKQDNNKFEDNFINKWKEVAKNNYDVFYELQRLFIKETYFDAFVKSAKKNNLNILPLLDYNSTSNMIWSTCVQHGTEGTIKILKKITPPKNIESLIELIYEERLNIISKTYPPTSSNPGIVSLYNGIKNRLDNEKNEIIRIYKKELIY